MKKGEAHPPQMARDALDRRQRAAEHCVEIEQPGEEDEAGEGAKAAAAGGRHASVEATPDRCRGEAQRDRAGDHFELAGSPVAAARGDQEVRTK